MNVFHCSKYFNKLFIFFGSFWFLLPLEATTYNLICKQERSFVLSYDDYISEDDKLISGRTKFKENKKRSLKKFNISYDLKKGTASIENVNVLLIKQLPVITKNIQEKISNYRPPIYLYQNWDSISKDTKSEFIVGAEDSFTEDFLYEFYISEEEENRLRIDYPNAKVTPFFEVKKITKSNLKILISSNDQEKDTLEINTTIEISNGFCSSI